MPPYPAADPGRVQPRGPGLPRLLDDRVVQARVRGGRGRRAAEARRRARGRCSTSCSRRPRRARWASILQPYWSPGVRDPGPGGEGRRHRLGRRPHPGAPVPRDPRGPRLRAARGRRADASSGRRCRSASCASRAAARRARPRSSSSPTSSGCRRRGPHTHETSGLGRGDRRGRRARAPPVVRGGGGVDDPDRRDPRAPADDPRRCTSSSTATSTCSCTSACSRCTRRSAGSPATRRARVATERPAPIGRVDRNADPNDDSCIARLHAATWSSPNTRNDRRAGPNLIAAPASV